MIDLLKQLIYNSFFCYTLVRGDVSKDCRQRTDAQRIMQTGATLK